MPMIRVRSLAVALSATLMFSTVAACSSDGDDSPKNVSAKTAALGTLTPGVIKVAVQPYAPYTTVQGGRIVGLDGDILAYVAKKLGLQVKPQVTDFAGMLAGVQSRRVDMTIGGVAWSADRQKQGLFTDPPYYSPPAMAVRSGKTYKTVNDLKGLNLGTVEGYVWVKSIQAVPGARLHAYPDATGVFDDLGAGRADVGFLDPLIIIAAQRQRPELKIRTEYLTPPTAAEVKAKPAYAYFQPYQTGFYLPKKATKLEKAVSAQIDAMYTNGELAKLVKKYGGDPEQFLKPAADIATARRGVDRPGNWTPPSIGQ
ncbi:MULTISPECIES: substrate-binding periplasmic protein [unclassified Streptomyces]|uniref:substrate-binding periplasmic protein n=1 Tax=unclassified Streptomyces TaxID=2593676 RepID=UPI0022523E6C|nr:MULTISPECIES: transporter substrate-binding domain-containing protein [unclassified Streptomyces]MCX5053262.1 transporter substrate-binding domain-containing protein [Streptomyces sp. NBC_00474]MCX5059469.1 transporter substrate-binding domain-containing protein [Streptomyces sp. NBC_00452]MCX5243886.1 transporter substrate-binding domain-containing protein [Streptomyces sp. NBC_00201]MCX5290380.1 transporter substrate-binding domain-containing protein [Streptomyces sp. NBC_00183]